MQKLFSKTQFLTTVFILFGISILHAEIILNNDLLTGPGQAGEINIYALDNIISISNDTELIKVDQIVENMITPTIISD
jgi:hypothetical protein